MAMLPGCKVMYGDDVLVDLTGDTVTARNLLSGVMAHDRNGIVVTGTLFPVGSLYATEDSTDNPAVTLGVGSWSLIPPANTVNQLTSQSESFVTTGEIYIWRRTA